MNGKALATSSPALQGLPSKAILEWINALEIKENKCGLHGFMLARHDKVIAQGWWDPYKPTIPHMLYSLSKSFTSTAVGFAVSEGLLSIDDKVISFFPEEAPENPSEKLKAMSIRNLLTMAHGQAEDANNKTMHSQEWVKTFLSQPVIKDPGTEFSYSTAATYMCSAILQKVTGQRVFDYLTPRLFLPLGIDPEEIFWEDCPQGICKGGTGLHIRTEHILRFGLTLLHNGCYEGKQVIPADWIAQATSKQIDNANGSTEINDWTQGYGFQFWRCVPEGVFRGDGAFGQYCVVMPKQDMVLAINAGAGNLQKILSLTWDILLPALQEGEAEEDPADLKALEEKLASLQLSLPEGKEKLCCDAVKGEYMAETAFRGLESMKVSLCENNRITFRFNGKEYTLTCEKDRWNTAKFIGMTQERAECTAASAGAWTDGKTYQIYLTDIEYPFSAILDLCFDETGCDLTYTVPLDWTGKYSNTVRLNKK